MDQRKVWNQIPRAKTRSHTTSWRNRIKFSYRPEKEKIAHLSGLYNQTCECCGGAINYGLPAINLSATQHAALLSYKAKEVITAAKSGSTPLIPDLYSHYSASLRKAVDSVYFEDSGDDLSNKLRANVSKFAAYKAYYATGVLNDILNDPQIPVADREKYAKEALKTFDRYHDAEYNTAVARSRTAKQFTEFSQPDSMRLFPSLRWLPSRSVNVRVAHTVFYNRVWKKTDPFWASNTPGTEWNCKCDVEETDDEVTSNSEVPQVTPPAGLEGNPAFTAEVFTDKASYIHNADKSAIKSVSECYFPDNKSKLRISVMPDISELNDNIRTGRILAEKEEVKIRPHFTKPGVKNPEFEINGLIADAKRLESWNVASGFSRAIKQECEAVVIDLYKMQGRTLNIDKLAIHIANRHKDFISGTIHKCFVVYNDKSVLIGEEIFNGFSLNDKSATVIKIKEVLAGLK